MGAGRGQQQSRAHGPALLPHPWWHEVRPGTWLNVKFAQSVVRVPFRLLTEEEERTLGKNFGDIKKQVEDSFKKKPSKE